MDKMRSRTESDYLGRSREVAKRSFFQMLYIDVFLVSVDTEQEHGVQCTADTRQISKSRRRTANSGCNHDSLEVDKLLRHPISDVHGRRTENENRRVS